MGKTREKTGMAADENLKQKEAIDEARKGGKTVQFASLNGHLSCQEFGVGTKNSKIQKVELYSEVTL